MRAPAFAVSHASPRAGALDAQRSFGARLEPALGDRFAALDAFAVGAVLDPVERAADRGNVVRDHRGLAFERLIVFHLYGALGRVRVGLLAEVALDARQAVFELGELGLEPALGFGGVRHVRSPCLPSSSRGTPSAARTAA